MEKETDQSCLLHKQKLQKTSLEYLTIETYNACEIEVFNFLMQIIITNDRNGCITTTRVKQLMYWKNSINCATAITSLF